MKRNPYGFENIGKGIGHYVTGRAVAAIATLVALLLLVRVMSVKDYGVFVTATGSATIMVMLSMCGLDRVVLKFLPEGRMKASSGDLSSFVLRIIGIRMAAVTLFIIVVLVVSPWLFNLLKIPATMDIVAATLLYVLFFAFTDFSVYCLQALMLQKQLRLSVSVAALARLLAVVATLLTGWVLSARSVLWIWVVSEFAAATIMALPLLTLVKTGRRNIEMDSSEYPRWPAANAGMFALASSNFLSSLAGVPWQPYALRAIAGALLPVQQIAAYGFFQILVEKIRSFLPVYFFASITEPLMSAHLTAGEEKQRVLGHMSIAVQASVWVVVPLVFTFAFVGRPAIELLTGGRFGESAVILAILFCQLLISSHVAMLWSFLSVLGESRIIWRAAATPSIVLFPLLIVCGNSFGMLGMALVVPLNTICILGIMIVQLRRMGYAFPIHWVPLLRIFLLALLVPLPAWGLMQSYGNQNLSNPLFIFMMVLGGSSYLAASAYYLPFTEAQAEMLSKVVPGLNRFVRKNRR